MDIHGVIAELIGESKAALEDARGLPASIKNSYGFGYQMGMVDALNAAVKLIMESDASTVNLAVLRLMEYAGPWVGADIETGELAFGFNPAEPIYDRADCPELYEFIATRTAEVEA